MKTTINFFLGAFIAATSFFSTAKAGIHPNENASTVQFSVSIADQWSTMITRKETDNMVVFSFKKADGTAEFLFSVCRIADADWVNVKDALSGAHVIEHKNGMFYVAMQTSKSKLRGRGNENFESIISNLSEMISSIRITE